MRRPWKPIIRELGDVHNNNIGGITINKIENKSKINVNTNYSIDTTLTP